ncbi:hypothetical protein HRbin24_01928 [bacterium HR24]|nr:hypothetical protein HRbin24_01928 [bacterium HR24]
MAARSSLWLSRCAWKCFSTKPVSNLPATKAGSFITCMWKGILVLTPTTLNSARARFIRVMACCRSRPQVMSLAIRGS